MIVISLTDCPPKVRGDLSKWLCEINTGVYVGNVSARVREKLWQRVCENVHAGRATMVFSAPGEQKMDFQVHNTTWEPVDFDGIKLMRRPAPKPLERKPEEEPESGSSRAERMLATRRINTAMQKKIASEGYVVLSIETTGLSVLVDQIIEAAALRIGNRGISEKFSSLVQMEKELPVTVHELTCITEERLRMDGRPLHDVLEDLLNFVGTSRIVSHNAQLIYNILRAGCKKCGLKMFTNPCTDTLIFARRKMSGMEDYALQTLASSLGLEVSGAHHALADCQLVYQLYEKLKEM